MEDAGEWDIPTLPDVRAEDQDSAPSVSAAAEQMEIKACQNLQSRL